MTQLRRVRLEIYGRVQGVFYRASTRDKSRQLRLSGWVKNRSDGSVEAVVEGANDAVDELIQWAHEGPSNARVDRVEITDDRRDVESEFSEFEIRR